MEEKKKRIEEAINHLMSIGLIDSRTPSLSIANKMKRGIEVLQRVMGHESIRTTQIYAKVLQENVDAEFDRLDDII